jgi:hypothetical protein
VAISDSTANTAESSSTTNAVDHFHPLSAISAVESGDGIDEENGSQEEHSQQDDGGVEGSGLWILTDSCGELLQVLYCCAAVRYGVVLKVSPALQGRRGGSRRGGRQGGKTDEQLVRLRRYCRTFSPYYFHMNNLRNLFGLSNDFYERRS